MWCRTFERSPTLAPASARPRATSYPIPPAPPVIITVLPSRRKDWKTLSAMGGFRARIDCLAAGMVYVCGVLWNKKVFGKKSLFYACERETTKIDRKFTTSQPTTIPMNVEAVLLVHIQCANIFLTLQATIIEGLVRLRSQ